ncbi:hypothetical protein AVEN_109754-1 [Araneus ventricosus]|uniref:Uncharacterized protein n=1 Tax=Araneus ventricosus TaxID=182803 RepID=A0A4Y2NGQ1_ARAVE|nr:hypothetical protein AVEN_109754-1 [Araneus ventricosus]
MREKGVIKSINNLSNRQQRIRRKEWKKDSRNYRKRKSLQQAKETPEAEETRVGSRGSPRIQSGRKVAKRTYSSLSEVQAAHFGASKKQLSLYTGVLYFKENTKDLDENAEADNGTKNLSFCTVSENLDHGAHAVWAHLKPILEELVPNNVSSKVDSVHFWTDGPSSQYKNRFNFFYLTELLPILCPSIKRSTWNFSAADHGKGPMDGVGGALKRMADTLVVRGTDITDSDSFLQNLKKTETTVKLYKIENTDIANLKEKSKDIPQISNIMQKHQIIWNTIEKKKITIQDLSCFSCIQEDVCSHFITKKRHVLMNSILFHTNINLKFYSRTWLV